MRSFIKHTSKRTLVRIWDATFLTNCFQALDVDKLFYRLKKLKILAIDGHHGILRTAGEHWKSVLTDTIALIHQIGLLEKCKLEDWASFWELLIADIYKGNFWTTKRIFGFIWLESARKWVNENFYFFIISDKKMIIKISHTKTSMWRRNLENQILRGGLDLLMNPFSR